MTDCFLDKKIPFSKREKGFMSLFRLIITSDLG